MDESAAVKAAFFVYGVHLTPEGEVLRRVRHAEDD